MPVSIIRRPLPWDEAFRDEDTVERSRPNGIARPRSQTRAVGDSPMGANERVPDDGAHHRSTAHEPGRAESGSAAEHRAIRAAQAVAHLLATVAEGSADNA